MFGILKVASKLDPLLEKLYRRVASDLAQTSAPGGAGTLLNNLQVPQFLPRSFLFGQDFQNFATTIPGAIEILHYPLYSFKAYATAGQAQLSFFDQNVGSATNGWGDTNMKNGGMLTGFEAMIVTSFRIVALPAQADYDTAAAGTPVAFGQWNEILNRNCWFEFWIGNKPYIVVGPLSLFPAGFGAPTTVAGAATVLRNNSWINVGTPDNKAVFVVDPPLFIQPAINLAGFMKWNALLTATTAGKIGVILDGYQIRPGQ